VTEPDIAITRVFAASRERVWREWTDPESFADWLGGATADVPLDTVSMDVRPGGAWRLTMYAEPGRREIRWRGEYIEVDEPERLVFSITDQTADRFAIVTVVLIALDGERTEMHFQQQGELPPEAYEAAKRGWNLFFDRVEERLAT
jgi:uncharacterized protein YndB with AHSA1/START domain